MTALAATPLFGVAVTVIAYAVGTGANRRWRHAHALPIACGLVIALLLLGRIPYDHYRVGGDLVSFFLGPATVALGVPLYKRAREIRRHMAAVVVAVTAGSLAGMLSAALLVAAARGSRAVMLSMIPKGVTTPISIELSRLLGGVPELTAVLTVLAGLVGSVVGPYVLRRAGVRSDMAVGLAIGTSSHGIGTARLVRDHTELAAAVSGLALALAGIVTSLLTIPLKYYLG